MQSKHISINLKLAQKILSETEAQQQQEFLVHTLKGDLPKLVTITHVNKRGNYVAYIKNDENLIQRYINVYKATVEELDFKGWIHALQQAVAHKLNLQKMRAIDKPFQEQFAQLMQQRRNAYAAANIPLITFKLTAKQRI